jgi:hypothetical protein
MEGNRVRQRRGPATRFPVVITFQTSHAQRERLRRARDTRAINMAQFVRDAVEGALNELEQRPALFSSRAASNDSPVSRDRASEP